MLQSAAPFIKTKSNDWILTENLVLDLAFYGFFKTLSANCLSLFTNHCPNVNSNPVIAPEYVF